MNETAIFLFEYLHHMAESPEGKVIYILSIICLLMIIDFITGTIAAWRNTDIKFSSQEGINGILRKLVSMIVLVACIPVSALVPVEMGVAALFVLYVGYMLMEFKSILENLSKLGIITSPLENFVHKIEAELEHKEGGGKQ
jgi:toxin secretion/phage lysis holin